jgi:hypothetical protein
LREEVLGLDGDESAFLGEDEIGGNEGSSGR